ncbi:hypothetical protein [Geomonas sp.]|uniref:hypothetical protein n=1 Tax=Geomonas sp. TaxID=2651584 RepID=UPI002B4896FE|nr:hypothetical protein [Geomonas sp.]
MDSSVGEGAASSSSAGAVSGLCCCPAAREAAGLKVGVGAEARVGGMEIQNRSKRSWGPMAKGSGGNEVKTNHSRKCSSKEQHSAIPMRERLLSMW